MRKLTLTAAAFLAATLAAGAADAQTRRGSTAAEGPAHPCRTALMGFDRALGDRIGPAPGTTSGAAQFADATKMRNDGMEACNAGRLEEGRRMIQQATSAVRG